MSHQALSILCPLGRTLLALMFVLSGISKTLTPTGVAGVMANAGLPSSTLLAFGVGVFEVVAGTALVIGFKTRWAAVALALFTLLATLLFHAYWAMPAEQQFVQQLLFSKNLALIGALLFTTAVGGGPWSLDAGTGLREPRDATTRLGVVRR